MGTHGLTHVEVGDNLVELFLISYLYVGSGFRMPSCPACETYSLTSQAISPVPRCHGLSRNLEFPLCVTVLYCLAKKPQDPSVFIFSAVGLLGAFYRWCVSKLRFS